MTLRTPIRVPVAYENAETKMMQTIGRKAGPEDWTYKDVTIYEVTAVEDSVDENGEQRVGFSELHIPGFSFVVRMDRHDLERLIEEHK